MKNLVFIFFALVNVFGFSQEKPKIGIVLSGGGAKGFAHIGVLKTVDSLGIKVDYVSGTSMGAIIGGLYAMGYTGNQLDSIFRHIDFDKLITDDLPRQSKSFIERHNSERYALTLPFNKFKIQLPSALSRGQNTYNLINRLTLPVSNITDFKQLPTPFFCVATNIQTGEMKILESGNLSLALIASGALPTLFQPVIINDETLVDGGVVNNYPIDELRAKGVDKIIGVDVQDGLASPDKLHSALDILVQINNFRTINDMKLKRLKTDVYIKPNIEEYSVISFDDGNKIINQGKKAALLKIDTLKQLAREDYQKPKLKIKNLDSISIKDINITGNEKYTRSYILGKLRLKANERVNYNSIIKGVNNVMATNNFNAFDYNFEEMPNDSYNLNVDVKESNINTFLKFGVHYDNLYKSAALVNFTRKRLLFANDYMQLDFILGDNTRYNFDYFIDKGFYWSFGIKSRYSQFSKNINAQFILNYLNITNTDLNKLNVELEDQTNQVYFETLFRKDFSLRLGGEVKHLNIKTETIQSKFAETKYLIENTTYVSAFSNLKLDTFDNKFYPTEGVYFNGGLHWYLTASKFNSTFKSFSVAKANVGYAYNILDKFSIILRSEAGFKIGNGKVSALDFNLGGYGNDFINNSISFIGYDFLELNGESFVKASATLNYEIFKKQFVTVEGNWANLGNSIFETGEWLTLPNYSGYALGYGIQTLIGPIQIKYSRSPERKSGIWYFNVGFWF